MDAIGLKVVLQNMLSELGIQPLYITLYNAGMTTEGLLIKANTGHEYFLPCAQIENNADLKVCLKELYSRHKQNNTH